MDDNFTIKRGQILYAFMPPSPVVEANSVQAGWRPVVVVSSPAGLRTSSIVMVCPVTTKIKNLSCNVPINWRGRQSQVLCNQITTVARDSLSEPYGGCGILTREEMRQVDIAMLLSLGVRVNFEEVTYYDEKVAH